MYKNHSFSGRFILFVFFVLLCHGRIFSGNIQLSSGSFEHGQLISSIFTCDGSNMSPSLYWSHDLAGVVSYALILEDMDNPAGSWVNWILYDIPADMFSIGQMTEEERALQTKSTPGLNDWGRTDYGGPCPPRDREHRYIFRIYALGKLLGKEGLAIKDINVEIENSIIGTGKISFRYMRE